MFRGVAGVVISIAGAAVGQQFPSKDWNAVRDPIASPVALKGGNLTIWGSRYPGSLNYYLDSTTTTHDLFLLMYCTLLQLNSLEATFEPYLATRWEISPDKRVFTFHIDPRAKWSDGLPITSRDVEWTYQAVIDPENLTGPHKVGMLRFEPPEILDERTIRFTAKEVHWQNLLVPADFVILPKHAMESLEFNKINFDFPVVSGPYRFKDLKEGFSVTLGRRRDWWLAGAPQTEGIYNFDEIKVRFIEKREDAFAAFLKGQTDFHAVYTSRIWVKEAAGTAFDNNWILKKKVFNSKPATLQSYMFNLRMPLFQDIRVRKAFAMLFDRRRMNDTLMYSQYSMHNCFYQDIYDKQHPNPHQEILFNPAEAGRLLDEAGWVVNPKTGIREKDGKPFSFNLLYHNPGDGKFFAIFDEALKDAGIVMNRERKDWAAWSKDMDETNFEISPGAWRFPLFKNPETMWHSREADRQAGQNYSGLKNEEIDRLIDQGKEEFDIRKRREMLRKVDGVLVRDMPYMLTWYADYTRLLYWNRFGMPDTVLDKFNDQACVFKYWWFDPDRAAELKVARELGIALPSEPLEVHFDEVER
jgi:microcin C transport system substrate-binding protein